MRLEMRVLVIDDNDLLRAGARMVLREFEVTTARSGEEGLELVGRQEFDAVLCDLQMPPGMSGLEVWRRLPEHLRGRFVLWTGAPGEAAGVEGLVVLAKPVPNEVLLETVRRAGT